MRAPPPQLCYIIDLQQRRATRFLSSSFIPQYKAIDPLERLARCGIQHRWCDSVTELLREQQKEEKPFYVVNHPQQYPDFVRKNLNLAHAPCFVEHWQPSYEMQAKFQNRLRTPVDVCGSSASRTRPYRWEQVDVSSRKVALGYGLPQGFNPKYMSFLVDKHTNQQMVLVSSNHCSVPLSIQTARLIMQWSPQDVVLETDIDRIQFTHSKQMKLLCAASVLANVGFFYYSPLFAIPMAMYNYLLIQPKFLPDMRTALWAANLSHCNVVLGDWLKPERLILNSIGKLFDDIQTPEKDDTALWKVNLSSAIQILSPRLAAMVKPSVWKQCYQQKQEQEPHDWFIFERRNDILSCVLNNCGKSDDRIVGVLGAMHVPRVIDRLTGVQEVTYPFVEPLTDKPAQAHVRVAI